eukprot:SAG31_NODE_13619_length_857_cov_0.881266_1_plen_112_part_00
MMIRTANVREYDRQQQRIALDAEGRSAGVARQGAGRRCAAGEGGASTAAVPGGGPARGVSCAGSRRAQRRSEGALHCAWRSAAAHGMVRGLSEKFVLINMMKDPLVPPKNR